MYLLAGCFEDVDFSNIKEYPLYDSIDAIDDDYSPRELDDISIYKIKMEIEKYD